MLEAYVRGLKLEILTKLTELRGRREGYGHSRLPRFEKAEREFGDLSGGVAKGVRGRTHIPRQVNSFCMVAGPG